MLVSAVAACGDGGGPPHAAPSSVRITRTPGLFILTPLDRTIGEAGVTTRLATDIEQLPVAPSGPFSCPIDFGTSYTLAFTVPGADSWTAIVNIAGCRLVKLSDGPTRWGFTSTPLYTDLGSALGLTQYELDPQPCRLTSPRDRCYAQPSPRGHASAG